MKRKLTKEQEFDILKLILDKYLWLGTLVMVFGLWRITQSDPGFVAGGSAEGIVWILAGSIVMFVLLWIIVKEYEFIK